MHAVWLRQFGGPEVLVATEVPDPVAGPGQALIEVAFGNITFVETQLRASGAGPFKAELPMVLGNGVGGVVTSVGAGVDGGLVGKRVVSGTEARAATPSLPPWMPGDWSRSRPVWRWTARWRCWPTTRIRRPQPAG